MRIPLYYVNAFTNQPLRGNPAAVCFLDSWLDDGSLRKVAAENNLSATAFVVGNDDNYQIRWFTARCELSLCGHATLASAYVMSDVLKTARKNLTFETKNRGILSVKKEGDLLAMNLPAFVPRARETVPEELFEALGRTGRPIEVLEVNETYVVVFDSPGKIQNLKPDFTILETLHPFVVSVTAPSNDVDFVSRYFAPTYGTPEDPVTGSAHCNLAPYWSERLGKTQLHARQLSERGGELWCEVAGNRVIVKGQAVLTMQGELMI